tara:strand:- start:294 stop:644 length:351 start_codon:yes stop_codon:yes gene_type:complete
MYTYKAKVLSVYDGDTITCLLDLGFNIHVKEKFRLYGIDTPEIKTKDLQEKKEGFKAKHRLQDLIEGKNVVLKVIKKGKFGRWISIVYLNESELLLNKSVNDLLVEENLAKPFMID